VRKSRAHSRDSTTRAQGGKTRGGGGGHCLDAQVCAAKRRAPTACLFTACNRVEGGGAHRSGFRAVDQHGTGDEGAGAKARNDDQGGHGSGLCVGLRRLDESVLHGHLVQSNRVICCAGDMLVSSPARHADLRHADSVCNRGLREAVVKEGLDDLGCANHGPNYSRVLSVCQSRVTTSCRIIRAWNQG
jgi:hypothetical protein